MRKQRELALFVVPLFVTVAASAQTIPDIKDSLEPVELSRDTAPFFLIVWAAVIAILAMLGWWKFRSRSHSHMTESTEARAHRRLGAIDSVNPRTFYTEVHDIFIEYLEDRFQIEASRLTTPELIEALADTSVMSEAFKTFLEDCDQAKFGPSQPARELDAAVAECRALIQQVSTAPLLMRGQRRQTVELV